MLNSQASDSSEYPRNLRRYLPDHVWERWQNGDSRLVFDHLQAVLRAVSTYLPREVIRARLADPTSPPVSGTFVTATIMFADISGFTAMSERLTHLGREGAEIITGIVNDYFGTMLEIIDRYGGDLFKFGGDALLVGFRGARAAARACAAALQMQEAMARFAVIRTVQGTFNLRMKVGLGTGTLLLSSLGTPERLEFAVLGPPLGRMASAESRAEPGEVLCDLQTCRAAGPSVETVDRAPGLYRVTMAFDKDRLLEQPIATELIERDENVNRLVERLDVLSPFIPPRVLERILASPSQRMIEGEHRLVTVLFANFYGIDEIIVALPPEQAHELTDILNRHFTAMQRVINRYGGIVNKVDTYAVGYRIMAVFGAPVAHEDDPPRAVCAALEMQQAIKALNQDAGLPTSAGQFLLKQRIGINSGYVFAGNLGSASRQEYSVMGDEVNLAARLMGVAAESQILISQSTARHVEGMFEWQAHEPVPVKGKRQPVPNYQVLRALGERDRRALGRGVFFGRQAELMAALAMVDRALIGQGAVLDIVGDPGVGKTRLVAQVTDEAALRGMMTLRGEATSIGHGIPYLPWITVLRTLFDFQPVEDPARRRGQLAAGLEAAGLSEWGPIVGQVLGLEIPETPLTTALDAQLRQQRFFDVVLQLLQVQAQKTPLLLVLDDMQWADAVSLDLVTYVARNAKSSPLLLLTVRRPDLEAPPWCSSEQCQTLQLGDMPDRESLDLARSVLGEGDLSGSLERLILDRAQGNPLFLAEVVRELRDSDAIRLTARREINSPPSQPPASDNVWILSRTVSSIEVPTTLTGLLQSRIDRLETTNRRLLQVAAVIGVDFTRSTLGRVYPYGDLNGTLPNRLDDLVRIDLADFSPPEAYTFRHTLTQEVAYASLPFARRRELHVRVGEDLEAHHAVELPEHYGVLARHFDEGRVFDKALTYLEKAGDKARAEFANEAALNYYERALQTAAGFEERDAASRTLDVLEAMGDIYLLISQYENAVDRFHEAAAHSVCPPRRRSGLLAKIARAFERLSQYDEALQFLAGGRWVLAETGTDHDSVEMARLYALSAWVQLRRGDTVRAIQECDQGLEILARLHRDDAVLRVEADLYNTLGSVYADLRDDYSQAAQAYRRSTDLREALGDLANLPSSYNNLAKTAWGQGDLDGARAYLEQSLEISRRIGHNLAIAFAYSNLGVVSFAVGDIDQALDYYLSTIPLRQRIGDSFGLAQTYTNLGEAYVALKQYEEARHYLMQAANMYEEIQSEGDSLEAYCLLAEIELTQGGVDAAFSHARRVHDLAQTIGNLQWQGIAERLQARAHTHAGAPVEAMEAFEASVQSLSSAENPKELARTHTEFGLFLAEQAGHEIQAREHLSRAVELYASIGADELVAQAQAALDGLGS